MENTEGDFNENFPPLFLCSTSRLGHIVRLYRAEPHDPAKLVRYLARRTKMWQLKSVGYSDAPRLQSFPSPKGVTESKTEIGDVCGDIASLYVGNL